MKPSRRPPNRQQRGVTLIVAMIFLVILMLAAVSAIRVSNVNTRVVGNMQTQSEAFAAAQQAIEQVISYDFTVLPQARTVTVDINDSGKAGSAYTVNVAAPVCLGEKPVDQRELTLESGGSCLSGNNGPDLCFDTVWSITATAVPPSFANGASVATQGIAVQGPNTCQ